MKLNHHIREYMTFNRQEQRGVFALLLLLSAMILSVWLSGKYHAGEKFDFSQYEKDIVQFERELKKQDSLEELEKKLKYRKFQKTFLSGKADTGGNYPSYKKEIIVIELNSADTFDLQRLRGIGPYFARRIIWYRNRLGGYNDKSQLLEVFGMDAERYHAISPNLTVNTDSVHPLDLNTITFKELMVHPYFPYGMAKAIMLYRKDHKIIKSIEDLKSIPGINDSVFRKIRPYIKVELP